ncbi:hypothetical protein CEP52_009041 [Fusarium oligoseptatum]|uniref:Uncharacterized protein n=2 Tax=Fusarium solani species complex TaxID=232080 RepID=A0A428TF48_9HYPO|nr:hypothetical protein CEP51_010069 [Fusarium floridanum]RSM00585.1 hypothetical protein CEP52_009041 [Fusarium oligoseptatum]
MPSADHQQHHHHLNLDGLQSLSISAPDMPSPPYEHRTTMTIQQDEQQPPATHWPQDIWLHSPSFRVLYQPVLVVPHQHQHQHQQPPPPSQSSPLQHQPAAANGNVPDAPLHDLSQCRNEEEEDPRPEGNPADGCGRYQPNGHHHAHSESKDEDDGR